MKLIGLALVMFAVACGGSGSVTVEPDSGVSNGITRGVQGTGSADAGGVWAVAMPCTADTAKSCPFLDAGFCGKASVSPIPFCVSNEPCPPGTASGAAVDVGSCLKICVTGADCASTTSCYHGLCVPY